MVVQQLVFIHNSKLRPSVAILSHAVTDWNIYKKWNEKFFRECYEGYLNGRAEKDPSEGWYKVGEVRRDF